MRYQYYGKIMIKWFKKPDKKIKGEGETIFKKQTKGYLLVAAAGILYCISATFKKLPSPP